MAKPAFQLPGRAVAFAPDGLCVVSDGKDWNFVHLPDGQIQHAIAGAGGSPTEARFSADGHVLAVVSGDEVRVWRVSDGVKLAQVKAQDRPTPRLVNVALSPDGSYVAASALIDRILFVWRVSDGKLLDTRHDVGYRVFGWARDGALFAGRKFRVQGEKLVVVPSQDDGVGAVSPMDLWSSDDGEMLATIKGESVLIDSLRDYQHQSWDLAGRGLTNVAWTPDKKRVALRFQTGNSVSGPHIRAFVEMRRVSDGALLHSMQMGTSKNGTDTAGTWMNVSGDGKWLVIESRPRELNLWPISDWTSPIPTPDSEQKAT